MNTLARWPLAMLLLGCAACGRLYDDAPTDPSTTPTVVLAPPLVFSVSAVQPGVDCLAGGARIDAGLDADRDAALDTDEISQSAFVCAGADGAPGDTGGTGSAGVSTLANVIEDAGACAGAGGVRTEAGTDSDGDGQLDASEVTSSALLCPGTTGAGGPSGPTGALGDDGFVMRVSVVAATCGTASGWRIRSGLDTDRDGILDDPDEVTRSDLVCAGEDGGSGGPGGGGGGVDEGTLAAPIMVGTLPTFENADEPTRSCTVGAGSTSYYAFAPPNLGAFTVWLLGIETDLQVAVDDGAAVPVSCDYVSVNTKRCSGLLENAVSTVQLRISEPQGVGNAFELAVVVAP